MTELLALQNRAIHYSMIYSRFLFLLLFTFFSITLVGQNEEVVAPTAEKQPTLIRYEIQGKSLRIDDIEVDDKNRIMVATDQMLLTIGKRSEVPGRYLMGKDINCVATGKKNSVYASNNDELFILEDATFTAGDPATPLTVALPKADLIVNDIAYLKGRIWLATNDGIHVYVPVSKNWLKYDTENAKLKSNIINSIDVDDSDVMWVGTQKGYLRIEGDSWELEDKRSNVLKSRANKEGQWMISSDDMWLIDPFNRKYPVGLDKSMSQGTINDFAIDSKGRIYIASDILVRYNPYEDKIEQYGSDVGLISKQCISLSIDKTDNVWIGTADAGLFRVLFDDVEQEQLQTSIIISDSVSCHDRADATLTANVIGGVKPYLINWSDGSSRDKLTNVKAGSYAVTVTDKFGTEATAEVVVSQPSPIEISIADIQRVSGLGMKDGMVEVAAKGGSGILKYEWSTGAEGPTAERLKAGTYYVSVTDDNKCFANLSVEIPKEKFIPELDVANLDVGKTLRINQLNFQADSTNLSSDNYEILDEVYDFLAANPNIVIEIGGHTNTIPPHSYCDKLSTARARSVAEYIVNKGIGVARVSYKGYGKRQPLTESTSKSARQKNQRVEVKILSI